jgi:hypothetical protein
LWDKSGVDVEYIVDDRRNSLFFCSLDDLVRRSRGRCLACVESFDLIIDGLVKLASCVLFKFTRHRDPGVVCVRPSNEESRPRCIGVDEMEVFADGMWGQ